MKVTLIYAYWSNRPFGMTWCDLPFALRDAGLPERLHQAGHDVVEMTVYSEGDEGEELAGGFQLAREIGGAIDVARKADEFPIVVCGSCSIAAAGVAASQLGGPKTGVVWCDAHPDLNTPETSKSGLFEGMALAVATGRAWQMLASDMAGVTPFSIGAVTLYGARDIDPPEQDLLAEFSVAVERDARAINVRLETTDQTYVHLDMDVHGELDVRANRFAVPDGPSVDEVRDTLLQVDRLAVLAVTGLDPSVDGSKAALSVAIDHICALADAGKGGVHDA